MNQEIEFLKKEVRKLRLIVVAMIAIGIIAMSFAFTGKTRFTEIDVERINVVEKNGDLKMVISNKVRQHPGRINGKELEQRTREAGIIFFNGESDECGGLVYDSDKESAGLVVSVDKYHEDQVMQLQYLETFEKKQRKYGLQFWTYPKENAFYERMDRFIKLEAMKGDSAKAKALEQIKADGLISTDRLFVGKNYQDDIGLFINDSKGQPRIRLYVDKNNTAKIELLDEHGKVVR